MKQDFSGKALTFDEPDMFEIVPQYGVLPASQLLDRPVDPRTDPDNAAYWDNVTSSSEYLRK